MITTITKPKIIYVCHPLSGDIKGNVARVRHICRDLYSKDIIPFAPHIYFTQFLDDNNPSERELALLFGREMVKRCDELWVFGDRISDGMRCEIDYAKKVGIPISYVGPSKSPQMRSLIHCITH